MQLHAFLLVFLFITDKAVAILHCGGNVPLDQEPAGHINLFPGLFNHTSRLNNMSQQSDEGLLLSNCTWMLGIPLRRKILLKLKWFERDSRILLRCVDEDQILQHNGTTVLLSGCHENKAVLSWTGPGISSNSIQLTYIVQELEGNSSDQPTHQQVQYPTDWSKTGATHKRSAKGGQEVEKSTKDRGHVYEEQMWSFGTPSMSSAVSQDEELQPPTSSQWGLPFAGRTDRETLSLPEEKWNNGADTSGAAHLTEKRIVAITHPNFQLPVSIDSKSQTENCTGLPQGQTETSRTDAKASLSANTYLQISASQMLTNTKKLFTRMDELAAIQTNPTASSFSVLNTSFTGILTSDGKTPVDPHGGAIGQTLEDNQAGSDRFYSAVTSIIILEHLKPSIKPPQHDSNNRDATLQSSSSPEGYRWAPSPTTHLAESPTVVDVLKSTDRPYNTDEVHTVTPSSHSQTNSLEKIERHSHFLHSLPILTQTNGMETQTATEAVQRSETNFDVTTNMIQTLFKKDGSPFTNRHAQMTKIQNSSPAPAITETYAPPISQTLMSPIDSPTLLYVLQTKTGIPDGSEIASTSSLAKSSMDMNTMEPKSTAQSSQTSHLLLPSTATVFPIKHFSSTASSPLPPVKSDSGDIRRTTSRQWLPSSTKPNPTAGPSQAFYPSQQNQYGGTSLELTPKPKGSSTKSPLYYIVPNHPATIRVELVELLLQLIIEDYPSAVIAGQEDDIKAWLETCLQKAPGFNKLLDIWSSGHVVQSLVEFKTSEALQWLSINSSLLLEQTGLVQAVHQGKMFRSSRITNITVGGQQGDVCDWLLQCPSGYKCVPQPGTSNYSCSSTCHFDYCHHHGICTHHPAQLPVCRCLVGDDFWYMGQRCDIKMTQARLIGACLAVMLIIMMAIGILAFLAVRRYRSILIQAKVDQTRSSYRKFNHFDELSGRFWLRSWAESADSLDNPAFMRSDELLHLRALDRPCCYHDDTLSLPSTSASHGTRINTIYPHSSQYGWRGSGMSMGDCVLDSGKASDLSVCSWPVEPIHWTPFPLLQQLASHRNPAVTMSRPRSYCEGMELVDLGKSWTA